jgi:chemotaxis protein methyltransferase CheR
MTLARNDFEFIKDFLYKRSAIFLEPNKEYLIEARLSPLATSEGLGSLGNLFQALRSAPVSSPLCQKVIEAMTTHETSFYRDPQCFFTLRDKILPELIQKRSAVRRLTIWSAACSSGQEPYSLLMMLREQFPALAGWTIRILATDISAPILARAKEGRYSQLEVNRGLHAKLLIKYFSPRGLDWQIDDSLRKNIEFCKMNLLDGPGAFGPFDLVLLRNVLIYFDAPAKQTILQRIKNSLNKDGNLIIGAAEVLTHLGDRLGFTPMPHPGFYSVK